VQKDKGSNAPLILADYTKSIEEIYINITYASLAIKNNNFILSLAGLQRGAESSLPSWVPDVTMDYPQWKIYGKNVNFSAGLNLTSLLSFNNTHSCLEIRGCSVDIIDE